MPGAEDFPVCQELVVQAYGAAVKPDDRMEPEDQAGQLHKQQVQAVPLADMRCLMGQYPFRDFPALIGGAKQEKVPEKGVWRFVTAQEDFGVVRA